MIPMHTLEKKQLNLLVHLAKVDGKFAKSEKELLQSFIREKKLDPQSLDFGEGPLNLDDFADTENKIELLYWALRVMHADGVIHEDEARFCKQLAIQLGLNQTIVDWATMGSLPEFKAFKEKVGKLKS
jgi:uncharacterized tellurite resistance protein B-like protein